MVKLGIGKSIKRRSMNAIVYISRKLVHARREDCPLGAFFAESGLPTPNFRVFELTCPFLIRPAAQLADFISVGNALPL